MENYFLGFKNYFEFHAPSSRSEFWHFFIIQGIVTLAMIFIIEDLPELAGFFYAFELFTFIPCLALSIRRLHDVGKSGWNILWLLTGIGLIYLVALWIRR